VTLAEDTSHAAQLLAFGLRPKLRPIEDGDYLELVRRFRQQDSFARAVRAVAEGMGLDILDVTEAAGVVLGAREGSVFAIRLEDYYRRAKENQTRRRVLHGIAQLAIAACCFPRPEDLEDPERAPRVAVTEVDEYVRDLCRRLDEQHAAREDQESLDPPAQEPELERAWRMYARQPQASATGDMRAHEGATRQVITKAFDALIEHGLMRRLSDQLGGTYQPTPAYRIHVRELSGEDVWFELDSLRPGASVW
jgi:hypothetical protein